MKYTQEQAESIFCSNGLILCDTYINNCTNLLCIDENDYKYSTSLASLLSGKTPQKIHANNPYVLHNIDLYIELNNITSKRVSSKYVNSKTDMEWQCECGSIFYTTWNEFYGGKHFCNFCAKSRRFDGLRNYTKLVREECEKRGYKLLTSYIHRSMDYFEYICNKHADKGIQRSTFDSMINMGKGCYYCGIESRGKKHRLPEHVFKELAEAKGFIYVGVDYDNDQKNNKKANIHIVCPKHVDKGVQIVKYDNLKNNTGMCVYCMGYGRTKDDLQKELDSIHGRITVLDFIDYSSPIMVKCNICGHEWSSTGVSLTQGHGCPNCNQSQFELSIARLLDDNNIQWIGQYTYEDCKDKRVLPFDFYLPDYNILIEADGEQHYYPINFGGVSGEDVINMFLTTQFHDKIKDEYCQQHKINLIRVPYWEKNNISSFLMEKILKIDI